MNYGAEPADQVVRYYLEGTEMALKLSGTAAKNFAVFALAVLKDQKKTHGKTNLVRLLRENKPLKFFEVPADKMQAFAKEAKRHGLLYVPIKDKKHPGHIEVAVLAEDAAKVNRVLDRLKLAVVDLGEAQPATGQPEQGQTPETTAPSETVQTEDGPVPFEVGNDEELFGLGFTQAGTGPAPKAENLSAPYLNSSASSPNPTNHHARQDTEQTIPLESGSNLAGRLGITRQQTSEPVRRPIRINRADRAAPAKPEPVPTPAVPLRPSVRAELREIAASLQVQRRSQSQAVAAKRPIKITRSERMM